MAERERTRPGPAAGEKISRVSRLALTVEDEGRVMQSPWEEDMERESEG